MDGQNTNALGLLKRYRAADKVSARRSDDTNGASFKSQSEHRLINRRIPGYDHSSPARALPAWAMIRSVTFHLEAQRNGGEERGAVPTPSECSRR